MRQVFAMMVVLVVALLGLQPPSARAHVGDGEVVMDAWIAVPVPPDATLQLVADTVTNRIDPAPARTAGVWTGTNYAHRYVTFFSTRHLLSNQLMGSWKMGSNRVSGTALIGTRRLETWGVEPITHRSTARLAHGTIAWVSATVAPSERRRLAAAQVAVHQTVSRVATQRGGVAKATGWVSTGAVPKNVMH